MQVCFVTSSTPPFDVLFNRVAAFVTGNGPYCHVECAFEGIALRRLRALRDILVTSGQLPSTLQRARAAVSTVLESFPPNTPDDHMITLAFHALAGSPLGVRVLSPRSSDVLYQPYSAAWRVYRLEGAPRAAVQAQLVWSFTKVGTPYDTMGALTSPWRSKCVHGGGTQEPQRWFCSSLALRFCQNLNMLSDLSLAGTTPNSLERALRQYIKGDAQPKDDGGTFPLTFCADHWSLVASIAPYIVRADLGVLLE